jgi:hypothetical protein
LRRDHRGACREDPPAERAPAFAIAVDLVLADSEASVEERKFIDALQDLLLVSDEAQTQRNSSSAGLAVCRATCHLRCWCISIGRRG